MGRENNRTEKVERCKPATWRRRVSLVACGIFIGLVCAEIAARFAGDSHTVMLRSDPVLGRRFIPGAEGWNLKEGRAYVRINSEGWRDRERKKEKSAGTFRIAVLGDSFTSARQVDLAQTFCAVIESELEGDSRNGITETEVLNFGVGGYGTAQEFLVLENCVWEYSPDVVLLAFFAGNDVSDNSKELTAKNGNMGGDYACKPFFIMGDDGKLRIDNSFRDTPRFKRNSSSAARVFSRATQYFRLGGLLNSWRAKGFRILPRPKNLQARAGLDPSIYKEPQDSAWREAWSTTEAILVDMHKTCTARNVRFGIVTLSMPVQVHPDAETRSAFKKELGVDSLFVPDRRIAKFGQENGIPVLNLSASMQERADAERVFFHGFEDSLGVGHWNAGGHLFAGRTIAVWLRDAGLAPLSADQPPP